MTFAQRIATIGIHYELNDPKFEIDQLLIRKDFFKTEEEEEEYFRKQKLKKEYYAKLKEKRH